MKRFLRGFLKVLLYTVGTLAVMVVALEILLSSPLAGRIATSLADRFLDCRTEISGLRISLVRHFPSVRLDLDSLTLTYPHQRFAQYAPRKGCGAEKDTLLDMGALSIRMDLLPLMEGEYLIDSLLLSDLTVYAHQYDSAANWSVFKTAKDTSARTESSSSVPVISVGHLKLDGRSELVYSTGSLFVDFLPESLRLSGAVRSQCDGLCLNDVNAALSGLAECRLDTPCDFSVPFDFHFKAKGVLQDDAFPLFKADIGLSQAIIRYASLRPKAFLTCHLSCDGTDKRVSAALDTLRAYLPGVELGLSGGSDDILDSDPRFNAIAMMDADLESLSGLFLPDNQMLSGEVGVSLRAESNLSYLSPRLFNKADITGKVSSAAVSYGKDSLKTLIFNPAIELWSAPDKGIMADVALDSLFLRSGQDLTVKLRRMSNHARIYNTEFFRKDAIKLELSSDNGGVFLKSGPSRLRCRELDASVAAVHVLTPRMDTIPKNFRYRRFSVADSLRTDGLEEYDFKVKVDSTLRTFLNSWIPSGKLSVAKGFIATPVLPLRSRLGPTALHFTGNSFVIDSLNLTCGSSDISAKGSVIGLRNIVTGRGPLVLKMDVTSGRLNTNELLSAIQVGRESDADTSSVSETDESFVVDTLVNSTPDIQKLRFIVPRNLIADVNLSVAKVDYLDLDISPVWTEINVRNRAVQVTGAHVGTGYGDIDMDAFYSTRSKTDISAGVNIGLRDISAKNIISLVPSIGEMLPALNSFDGKFMCDISMTSQLDTLLNVNMPSLNGMIHISGEDLFVADAGDLRRLTRLLLFKNKNIGAISNLDVSAIIHDNRVDIHPFLLEMDRYRLALEGMNGFDGSVNYYASVIKSPFLIPFGIKIYGNVDKLKFGLGKARYVNGQLPVYTKQLDSIQVNIAESIRSVYLNGVQQVRRYNQKMAERFVREGMKLGSSTYEEPLSMKEYVQVDSLMITQDFMQNNLEIDREVEEVLESTAPSVSEILADLKKKKK